MSALRLSPDWSAARAQLAALGVAPDTRAAAVAYFARWPKHEPDYFVNTTRKNREAVRLAFGDGEGWPCRLLSCLETPAHFSLHAQHLDLDPSSAAPHLLFDRGNVRLWKAAILRHFRGPFRARLALGEEGRVHCHVLADLSDGPPGLPRGGRIARPCESYFENAVSYQLEPPMSWNAENLALWMTAKKRGRLPTMAWSRGVPQKRRWHERSVLRKTFGNPPENATPKLPETARVVRVIVSLPPAPAAHSGLNCRSTSYPVRRPAATARGPPPSP